MRSPTPPPFLESGTLFSLPPSPQRRASFSTKRNPIISTGKSLAAPSMTRSYSASSHSSQASSFFSSLSVGAPFMDRNSNSSGSSTHSRLDSLSTACAPVTSSYHGGTPDSGNGNASSTRYSGSVHSSPTIAQRGWVGYDWDTEPRRSMTQSPDPTTKESASGLGIHLDDDSYPERLRKSSNSPLGTRIENGLVTILEFPSVILALFLSPLNPPPHHYFSPQMNRSTAPTPKLSTANSKRHSLPLRLLTIAYLSFSVVFLALRLTGNTITTSPSTSLSFKAMRITPRADTLRSPTDLDEAYRTAATAAGLESDAGAFTKWAKKMGERVSWNGRRVGHSVGHAGERAKKIRVEILDGLDAMGGSIGAMVGAKVGFGEIARIGQAAVDSKRPETNPLTPFSHTYRFAKMHDKVHSDLHDEIEPFAFHASIVPSPSDITACFYSNEAWLSTLSAFVLVWEGPISLTFETAHSRHSPARSALVDRIVKLRESDPLIRDNVDFHFVGTPLTTSEKSLNRTRERLITRPVAMNFHQNLARFFAPTDIVWMVNDARVVPSKGLRERLRRSDVLDLVLERGDAIVVPTFGFVRDPTGAAGLAIPSLDSSRHSLGLSSTEGASDGVAQNEFDELANYDLRAHYETLPLSPPHWPTKKSALVSLVSTRPGSIESPSPATLALFDESWDLNRGPTNWYLWRKAASDPRLGELPDAGGGLGLGVDGSIGGGKDVYRVAEYDLHYAPNVVMSQKGQPWCTERFEHLQSACVYQVYLSGAELWVLPDEWAFTLQEVEEGDGRVERNPAGKLKNSITARLFGKFHQEACMHYGREFLSIQMWNSDKAQHLRATCERVLTTWGMGLAVQ